MGTAAMIDEGYAPGPGGVILGNVNFIPPGLEPLYKAPFSYVAYFDTIASGATKDVAINIENDSYFVTVSQTMDIWDAATGNTTRTDPVNAPMTVTLKDTSSGMYQMNQPAPVGSLFGTAEQPFVYLYRSRVYLPGGQLLVSLMNRMAAAQTVRAVFTGFKVYRQQDKI